MMEVIKTVIVIPVGNSCNLKCTYCYHKGIQRTPFVCMSDEILEEVVRKSLETFNAVRFLWHGGEPLMAGKDFFGKVLFLQEKYKKPDHMILNGVQTNATLVDDQYAEFLFKNRFSVSTSLDGPPELHNIHRNNSFDKVLKGIEALNKYFKRIGLILVINKDNVDYPDEIYNFFSLFDWFQGFEPHPCMPVAGSDNGIVPDEDKLVKFLCRIFDLWFKEDNPNIHIRMFKDVMRVYFGGYPQTCAFQRKGCYHLVSIDHEGSIYTCSRFFGEKEGYIGSISDGPLVEMLTSKPCEKKYKCMVELPDDCSNCEWLDYCGGGCAYQRWLDGWGKYYQCNTRRKVFKHIVSKLKAMK